MKCICVYSGSSPGARAEYAESARALGRAIAERGLGLVYGGARVGLMGELADAALDAGGDVTGVIPVRLEGKVAHTGLTELVRTETMHERKARMAELADAFIALPGGIGTLEEIVEVLTWAQLGLHVKPCGLLNVCGYFDPLLAFISQAVDERFVKPVHRDMLLVDDTPAVLLDRFATYESPKLDKWLDLTEGG
jgi:uncharacterized protein (TIGR00730 family)